MGKILETNDLKIPAFGYELLRDEVIPEILGRDSAQIMYWTGRAMGRKYPCNTIEEIIAFFEKTGWGSLQLLKEKKEEMIFELSSPLISSRLSSNKDALFGLESGFLAESVQSITNYATETHEKVNSKKGIVTFTARWDLKEQIE
jgi:predicted hydrocarbon binding protein